MLTIDSVLFRCPVYSPPCGSTLRDALVPETVITKLCICHPRDPSFGLVPYFSLVTTAGSLRARALEGTYSVHHPFQALLQILLELAFRK